MTNAHVEMSRKLTTVKLKKKFNENFFGFPLKDTTTFPISSNLNTYYKLFYKNIREHISKYVSNKIATIV